MFKCLIGNTCLKKTAQLGWPWAMTVNYSFVHKFLSHWAIQRYTHTHIYAVS